MVRSLLLLSAAAALSAQSKAPRSLAELKIFFQVNCVKCHGIDGSATGADGKRLKGQDFTSAKEMKGTTDAELARTIRNGIFFGRVMPSFKNELSEEEIKLIVQEIVRKAAKGKPIAPLVDSVPVRPAKPEEH